MNTELIWKRLISTADRPGDIDSDTAVQALLLEAMTVGTTITPDSVGCSVTESRQGGFHTPVASSSLAMDLDAAQYDDDDGPCVAACRDGRPHSITVMADEQLYPGFTRAALTHGVRSSLSLPLPVRGRTSALNLYARSSSAFDPPHAKAVALLLARCTAAVLTAMPPGTTGATRPGDSSPSFPGQPQPRFDANRHPDARLVARALATLRARDGRDASQAFAELTRRSRVEGRKIIDIARDLAEENAKESGA